MLSSSLSSVGCWRSSRGRIRQPSHFGSRGLSQLVKARRWWTMSVLLSGASPNTRSVERHGVEPDCSWDAHAEVLLPTFTGPRPASSVHPRSANSVSASAGAPARWVKHSCRLHVRHDEAENMITCSDGSLRLQGTREREVSGFQPEKFIFICIWIRHCWCRPAEGLLQQVSVNCDRASVLELPQA